MEKVMILANNDVGLYKFRKELIEALLREYEVHIVLPYGSFVDELTSMGCIYHATEFERRGKNPLKDLNLLISYKKLISEIKPDIVFTYTIKPNIYGGIVCAAYRIPYVVNITGLGTAVENGGFIQVITTSLYKFALRKATKVFFQNEDNLCFMKERGIVKGNTELLPGSGVNLKRYQMKPYPNRDTVDFIFVARVMKEKGIEQYLDAARYITQKYPNTHFHIYGMCEGAYLEILQSESEQQHIVYHGAVADMNPVYEMCSCTVHPTYYPEGMSNVLLESCASGRPIITTNRPGCREIVDDGINGFVCAQKDSADLIAKIEQFLHMSIEQREAMGRQARLKVERSFDRQIVVEKYMMEVRKFGRVQESVKK